MTRKQRVRFLHGYSLAFSLLEVLFVIALIAIISAIALPNYFLSSNKASFQNDEVTLQGALNLARDLALSRKECFEVQILNANLVEVSGHTPNVSTPPCPDPLSVAQTIAATVYRVNSKTTIAATFSNGTAKLVFTPTGGIRDTATVTLSVTGKNSLTGLFTIYPTIGQIRVQ